VAVVLTLVHTIQKFSPGGSSPYTSTHNTNGNIIYIKVTIQTNYTQLQNKIHTVNTGTYIRTPYTHYKNIYTLTKTSTPYKNIHTQYKKKHTRTLQKHPHIK
jgi:hypothetical protein